MTFNEQVFYSNLRKGLLGPTLSNEEVAGCQAILKNCKENGLGIAHAAQCFATAYHETGGKMFPVKENLNYSVNGLIKTFGRHRISAADAQAYGRTSARAANQVAIANIIYGGKWGRENLGNIKFGDGAKYIGHGMSQETGLANYIKVDNDLNLGGKLVENPKLLLDPDIAAKALVTGMIRGRYRKGHTLERYLPKFGLGSLQQHSAARLIINPDKNGMLVARAALQFQTALQAGGW